MTSPYLTTAEAAGLLRYRTVSGFRRAAQLRRIPNLLRGRTRLYKEADLIACWANPARVNLRIAKQAAR